MRWRELWDDLRGEGHERVRDPMRLQIQKGVDITRLLLEAVARRDLDKVDVDRVQRLEDEADDALEQVLTTVSRSLTTSIDREDLFRVSRSLDDVVDNLRDFAVEVDGYGVADQGCFHAPLEALLSGCEAMDSALDLLGAGAGELARAARDAKHANKVRDAFHQAMSHLMKGELTMATIGDRELLRRLDVTGLRLGEAADALASGALKRG
jgi:uncharacterized protein Yka (UPF0111/DUF47 family)